VTNKQIYSLTHSLSDIQLYILVQFKLCLLYKALYGMAPDYIRELRRSVSEDDARGSLRSAERGDLIVPRAATKFGDRAFAISASQVL